MFPYYPQRWETYNANGPVAWDPTSEDSDILQSYHQRRRFRRRRRLFGSVDSAIKQQDLNFELLNRCIPLLQHLCGSRRRNLLLAIRDTTHHSHQNRLLFYLKRYWWLVHFHRVIHPWFWTQRLVKNYAITRIIRSAKKKRRNIWKRLGLQEKIRSRE